LQTDPTGSRRFAPAATVMYDRQRQKPTKLVALRLDRASRRSAIAVKSSRKPNAEAIATFLERAC